MIFRPVSVFSQNIYIYIISYLMITLIYPSIFASARIYIEINDHYDSKRSMGFIISTRLTEKNKNGHFFYPKQFFLSPRTDDNDALRLSLNYGPSIVLSPLILQPADHIFDYIILLFCPNYISKSRI